MIEFIVDKNFDKYRLDKFIKEQNNEILYSRTLIEKYINEDKVLVNSKIFNKKSLLLKENDVVHVLIEKNIISDMNVMSLLSENIPLKILYEDDYLAIIDKPAGMTVHPGAGNRSGTLVNALLNHYGENLSMISEYKTQELNTNIVEKLDAKSNIYDYIRPGIVHRLDKDTSGLIIITKDNQTHFEMSQLFMNRNIEKSYLCLCLGIPEPLNGTIIKPISRNRTDRKKMSVVDIHSDDIMHSSAKDAITHYRTMIELEYFALLELKLETGRTHQIRVHLESIHHPVLGDNVYNSLKRTLGSCPPNRQTMIKMFLTKHLQRQALHAWKIKFIHPRTKKEIYLEADIPEDITKTIEFLKKTFIYYEIPNPVESISRLTPIKE
ncbi:MAG: RluA family pseudouridine synthase [Candidatus Cloacimonetes bacterium]|nr:RluA family pseudouridine synthase [Candidatus Cloacimonadota bacterium]